MTRVDSHIHFWRLARGDYAWLQPSAGPLYRDFQPEEALQLLAACGVQQAVAVQAAPTEAETRYLFELARQHPFIAGVVGWSISSQPRLARESGCWSPTARAV